MTERVQNSTFAATMAGAVTAIAAWVVQTWTSLTIPPEVASAITVITMAVATHCVPDAPAGASNVKAVPDFVRVDT
jgi:hypothetical protein